MKTIIEPISLNHIPRLNDYLDELNREMDPGDRLECIALTIQHERDVIRKHYSSPFSHLIIGWYYVWHNMFPKMRFTRKLYFFITGERHRTYSRTEVLGRVARAGFRILDDNDVGAVLHIVAEKKGEPLPRNNSCVSPIVRLPRIGKDGKLIDVFKFRTMYSYAQYLQEYVYERNNLREGGKLKDDFRVNIWGKLLRPLWLDELPMIWNFIRGDMKLVGVRPLSPHYFSLYTPEMQALRTKVRPGLIPPFYYESKTPKTLDEVQASERRYLEAYLRHPFRTDWRYFWGTLFNILSKFKHSH